MPKPATIPGWAAPGGSVVEPLAGKKTTGWAPAEKPPAQNFNWFWNLVSDWIGYLNGLTAEALEWTGAQKYVANALRIAHAAGQLASFYLIPQGPHRFFLCLNVSTAEVTEGADHTLDTFAGTVVDNTRYSLALEFSLESNSPGVGEFKPLIRLWGVGTDGVGYRLFASIFDGPIGTRQDSPLIAVRAFALCSGAGGLIAGADFGIASNTRVAAGTYDVATKWANGALTGAVFAQPYSQTAPGYTATALKTGTNVYRVQTYDATDTLADCPFSFAILGG